MIGKRRRSGMALIGVAVVLLAGTAGCGEANRPQNPDTSASQAADPTGTPSAAEPTGLLYSEKSATFSSIWAVEHDCPTHLYIDLTDSGPLLRDPVQSGKAGPSLHWTPSCTDMLQQIDFDGAPVAKVSGPQTQSSCLASAERSLRDGSALDGYRLAALAVGDEFCEHYRSDEVADLRLDRVIFLRVTSVSASNPVEITWSVTMWALPWSPSTFAPTPGALLYADQTFVIREGKSCVPASVNLQGTRGPLVRFGQDRTSGDIVYFPVCLGGGKIRFGGRVAPVSGEPAALACEHAAAAAEHHSLDVALTDLRAGSAYCELTSQPKAVFLVKVVSVATSPVSITFSVTGWVAPI